MIILSKNHSVFKMSPFNEPIAYVEPKTKIAFETNDCFFNQIKSENDKFNGLDWDKVNPATGPLYINGAEPGDILSVKIEQIETADIGVAVTGKGLGILGGVLEDHTIKIISIRDNMAIFSDNLHIPLNKMIGVIGTAPEKEAVPCGTPGIHGGNMDCKEIKEGVTVLLPVNVVGALLAIGDLHGVMADGEVGFSGLEVAGRVIVTVDVIKNKQYPLPFILSDNHVMALASHEDLDQAVESAVLNMQSYLVESEAFHDDEAAILLSFLGDVKICQVVDPKKTVRVEFPKKYLTSK